LKENSDKLINISTLQITTSSESAGKNMFVYAAAAVTMLDSTDSPVERATVSGK
jgi:hypothetical protein